MTVEFFTSPDCAFCVPVRECLEEMSSEFDGKISIKTIDTEKHPNIASKKNIRILPSIIANGKKLMGVYDREEVEEFVISAYML